MDIVDDIRNLKIMAFEYAINILEKQEIAMHLKDKTLDVFELANKIYKYLLNTEDGK